MTLIEIIKLTDSVPNRATLGNGLVIEMEVEKGKLGYIAYLWRMSGTGLKDNVIAYGTGNTEEDAKETLKKKLLKQ